MRLWETLGENLEDLGYFGIGFARLWDRIHKTLGDIGRGFTMICEDGQDFGRFGRGFVRIMETLAEDL